MGLFRLLARVTIGLLFVGHGTQKLFGWFGGGGWTRPARCSTRSASDPGAATL
jgi:putative oxidoreductase